LLENEKTTISISRIKRFSCFFLIHRIIILIIVFIYLIFFILDLFIFTRDLIDRDIIIDSLRLISVIIARKRRRQKRRRRRRWRKRSSTTSNQSKTRRSQKEQFILRIENVDIFFFVLRRHICLINISDKLAINMLIAFIRRAI
jgi:hypothetical protein